MTDRLTPPMLRDLAALDEACFGENIWSRHVRKEAARREAEQPCDRPGECEVGGCLKPSLCQAAAVEDKPAPAADDLPTTMRHYAANSGNPFFQRACRDAADLIEAQAREIAELKAERDKASWAHEDLMNEREAMFSDKERAEARVRELEAAVITAASNALAEKARADRLAAVMTRAAADLKEQARVANQYARDQRPKEKIGLPTVWEIQNSHFIDIARELDAALTTKGGDRG